MKKLSLFIFGIILCLFSLPAYVTPAAAADILSFETMVGVSGPFRGIANPIRGVPGGGLPWMIESGRGHLEEGGNLQIEVEGLVLADDPAVPANQRGVNPAAGFRGLVSCMSMDGLGAPTTVNVSTDSFPTDAAGNAVISAVLELPHPCLAPIIFVTSPTGNWFAVTGN